jgi:ribosomal protein S18 acetylase RimI-like enzyme
LGSFDNVPVDVNRAADAIIRRATVVLWTAEQNRDAQRLFERLGFRRTMVEMTREL